MDCTTVPVRPAIVVHFRKSAADDGFHQQEAKLLLVRFPCNDYPVQSTDRFKDTICSSCSSRVNAGQTIGRANRCCAGAHGALLLPAIHVGSTDSTQQASIQPDHDSHRRPRLGCVAARARTCPHRPLEAHKASTSTSTRTRCTLISRDERHLGFDKCGKRITCSGIATRAAVDSCSG
jgi:hypothetical protein